VLRCVYALYLALLLCFRMRELLDFLPLSNKDPVPIRYTEDPK